MNRFRLAVSLAAIAVVLCLPGAGCRTGADDAYLRLSWEDFDQNPGSGWRPLAESGDYAAGALMIENYLDRRDDLLAAQRGYSSFHCGQLWALHGDTGRALKHLDRAEVADMPPEFPRTFNALVAGTRAFLRGDMAGVRAAHGSAAAVPDPGARDLEFIGALELLQRCEGMTYLEVYEAAVAE